MQAANGWLQLGNLAEALAELERIAPPLQNHAEVIETRCAIHSSARDWPSALALAEQLVQTAPDRAAGYINRAFALHELQRTSEALAALLPARERFPREFLIPYNLACYCCRLGRSDEALDWLRQAARLAGREPILAMARRDADLTDMQEQLHQI